MIACPTYTLPPFGSVFMLEITKVIEWDMGHRVPNHANKCRNPHGHRYRLEVSVTGQVNNQLNSPQEGMICDFFELKEILKTTIHDQLDHRFAIAESDTVFKQFFEANQDHFSYITVPFIPTVENLLLWCVEKIQEKFGPELVLTRARLYETMGSWADYHAPK